MDLRKRIAALTLAAALTAGTMPLAMADNAVKDDLIAQISAGVRHNISDKLGEDLSVYSNFQTAKWTEAQPSRFDLRERGIVPAIRSQGSLGTCWSFASIAAAEISVLNSLGMTIEEYEAAYGEPLHLSEKHLAWFSAVPLPESEGEVQAGEGRFLLDPDAPTVERYQPGGFLCYTSGQFASGMGPIPESMAPYEAADGTDSLAGDWSLDEDLRFVSKYELKDSSILPCPAGRDANNNYIYNPVATAMIKSELLSGRAVSICYAADQAMDPDAEMKLYRDWYIDREIDPRIAEITAKLRLLLPLPEDITMDEIREAQRILVADALQVPLEEVTLEFVDNYMAEQAAAYEATQLTPEEEAALEAQMQAETEAAVNAVAEKIGADPAYIFKTYTADQVEAEYFINPKTSAQYTSNPDREMDHAVTIIGYDDDYAVSNFREESAPPAPGAWIVRNSWGKGWGNDGYFYLSYYDMSISAPESFEFVTDVDAMTASQLYIHQYDFLPASGIHSTLTSEPVYMANEFTIEADSVLSYVSAMTANYDTNVTVAVYLLNEDAASPIDGRLLDVRTMNYDYAGYHRIALNQHYLLPVGTRISVVQTQRVNQEDGRYYALPYSYATSEAFSNVLNELPFERKTKDAAKGVINHGESFVCADGEWADWADFIDSVKDTDAIVKEYSTFDNISIKAYSYMLSDITREHTFGEPVPYANGTVQLCTDCGYALVMQ